MSDALNWFRRVVVVHGTVIIAIVSAVLFLGPRVARSEIGFLKGRVRINETAAVGNLKALAKSLDIHRTFDDSHSYPDDWLTGMYTEAEEQKGVPYGLLSFGVDMQTTPQKVQGYLYQYTPSPAGCAEPNCTEYTITAVPAPPIGTSKTGERSFFLDESGTIRHCTGVTGAKATNPPIDQAPTACEG